MKVENRYGELLKVKLEKVTEIAATMRDVDAAYLAGRLDGILDNQRQAARAAETKKVYDAEVM